MPGVSSYDPIDNLSSIDDPFVKYLYSKKKIVEDLGLRYIGQLYFIDASAVSGIDAEKRERGLARLRQYLTNVPGSGVDAYTLYQRSRELVHYIHTGSVVLDYILGGGIRTGIVTEFAGPYRSGKTQISLTSSIAVQLPSSVDTDIVISVDDCKLASKSTGEKFDDLSELDPIGRGLSKTAIYIDTEKAFDPARLIPIAKRFGLDPEEALKNITVFTPMSTIEQFDAAYKAGILVPEKNVGLVVVDSLMNLFRAEYSGRERLAERQQMVNKFVHLLTRIAEVYNIAVIVTNQVMEVPEMRYMGGADEFGLRVVGGHVVAHNVGIRVMLNTAPASASKRSGSVTVRRAKIVDASFLPQREARFGIIDIGVVDVDLEPLCNFVVSDYIASGEIRGGLDRLILPPSQAKISRKLAAMKAAKARKGIKSKSSSSSNGKKKKSSK